MSGLSIRHQGRGGTVPYRDNSQVSQQRETGLEESGGTVEARSHSDLEKLSVHSSEKLGRLRGNSWANTENALLRTQMLNTCTPDHMACQAHVAREPRKTCVNGCDGFASGV